MALNLGGNEEHEQQHAQDGELLGVQPDPGSPPGRSPSRVDPNLLRQLALEAQEAAANRRAARRHNHDNPTTQGHAEEDVEEDVEDEDEVVDEFGHTRRDHRLMNEALIEGAREEQEARERGETFTELPPLDPPTYLERRQREGE